MNSTRIDLLRAELKRIDGKLPGSGLAKHKKMAASPFVFFRGSAQLFYADLCHGTLSLPSAATSLPLTTVMGDCHTSNFGFLTEEGSHGDQVIFSPNDFDDACIGHAAWDWLRFAASLFLCVEHCQGIAAGKIPTDASVTNKPVIDVNHARTAVDSFFEGYLNVCQAGARGDDHFGQTLHQFSEPKVLKKGLKKARSRAAGGDQFDQKSSLARAVNINRIPPEFDFADQRYARLPEAKRLAVKKAFAPFMDDVILSVCERKNAGTGSVNMERFYLLVGPQDYRGKDDLPGCHIVEVKQQRHAAPIHFFADLSPVNSLNPAHLTAVCQRRMQRKPDLLLDEAVWRDQHWLVRSRHHAKVGIDPEDIGFGKDNVDGSGFARYAYYCGEALALAHCRGERRSQRFERAVIQTLPELTQAIQQAASDYARQVCADTQWLASVE
jgi:hypothetical protein